VEAEAVNDQPLGGRTCMVVEYYQDQREVKCYEEGGECSSDED